MKEAGRPREDIPVFSRKDIGGPQHGGAAETEKGVDSKGVWDGLPTSHG